MLIEVSFRDLWDSHGIFTTMRVIGKSPKIFLYKEHINNLIKFHNTHKKIVTISAVRPPARFGSLSLSGSDVLKFKEKTQLGESWINGGFFVSELGIFDYLKMIEQS